MIKSVTIFLFILLLGSTAVMSQSNTSVQDKTDSTSVINNQQQAVQQNSNTVLVADSTAVGVKNTKNQIPLEKQFLDKQNGKKMRKQLQEIKKKRNQAIENGESTEKYDEQIQKIEKLILQDDKINKEIQ